MEMLDNLGWIIWSILIGLFTPIILVLANKQFGISSAMQNICSVIVPKTRHVFTKESLKKNDWKLYLVIGIVIGGFLASNPYNGAQIAFLPEHYYSFEGLLLLFLGGFLVGFGTRYANGCTSGHSITGLSMLKLSSLLATIAFFTGGFIYTFLF